MKPISGLIAVAARALKVIEGHGRNGNLPTATRLTSAQTFLVLCYENALGSAINSVVLFEALRRVKPDAYIAVACNRLVFNVLEHNPFIDDLVLTADPPANFLRAAFDALLGVVRAGRRFDCLIASGGDRPRIEAMALLLGRGLRIGHGSERTFHIPFRESGELSVIAENLRVADLFGEIGPQPLPKVYCSAADEASTRQKLIGGGWTPGQPLFVFASQGSGGQPTDWYEDRFAVVADRLTEQYGALIVFTGAAAQAPPIDRITAAMRNPGLSLAGLTTIGELSALISISDLMVTVDTGSMHLARSWRTPMVVIASAWQPAHLWLPPPTDDRVRVLRRDHIPCALCQKFYCATRDCLDEIGAGDVIEAARSILDKFPPRIQVF